MAILITGAAGNVGTVLRRGLTTLGWELRLLDRIPVPDRPDAIVADINDGSALDAAMHGVDAVIHLAGIPDESSYETIRTTNIDGTYQVFEAARRAGVARVVFASSNHAAGFVPQADVVPADVAGRPDTLYGLSKVFGEALGRLYHDRFGMDVICLRIGSFRERPVTPRHLATWLSPRDGVQLFHCCIAAPAPGYVLSFAVSDNTRRFLDIGPLQALGYRPLDNAEEYAATISYAGYAGSAEECYVGGEYAVAPLGEPMR